MSGLNKDEIYLDDIKRAIKPTYFQNIKKVIFKGTTGDPIIAKDFVNIIKHIRNINESCTINVSTNGSLHNEDWWGTLSKFNINITFGIDGDEDTHSIYRVNTDYNKVLNNAKSFINNGGAATWQFIIFKHNEHQIEECRRKASLLGFKNFKAIFSDRYENVDEFRGLDKAKDGVITKVDIYTSVECKSTREKAIFIYADGTVWPCCWLGGKHLLKYNNNLQLEWEILYNKVLDKNTDNVSIIHHTLDEILKSDYWLSKYPSLINREILKTCKRFCGKCSR